ncbi:MAG: TPM domain-containing protein [Erythrobacter sp.]|nr:TPM domain-containing protein [Erythrobacter sp.]
MSRVALLFLALAALLAAPLAAQPEFPELTGRVVDNAEIISPEVEAQLTTQLEELESQSQRQLVVVTLPSLQDYEIADYGYQLGREWRLGDVERNDGALLIVAPNEREVRIEVGYGLEGQLTDAYASTIIRNEIVPYFRNGDMEGGIVAGTTAIANHLALPEAEAIRLVTQTSKEANVGSGDGWLVWLLILAPFAFVILVIILASKGGSGGTRYSGSTSSGTSVSTYSSSSSSSWSSGSSFSSSSFSGGGGSFGGGGASGSW